MDLKYDWNNLFLACAHCNHTKSDKYDPIIDCTKENVEELIAFRKKGYFGTDEEREDLKYQLKRQLEDASPFAAFKRWLIRDNRDAYPELSAYI